MGSDWKPSSQSHFFFFVCLGKPGRRMLTLKQPAWLESKPGKKDAARDKKRRQTSEHLGGGSVQTQGLTGYGELQEWWSHSPGSDFCRRQCWLHLELAGCRDAPVRTVEDWTAFYSESRGFSRPELKIKICKATNTEAVAKPPVSKKRTNDEPRNNTISEGVQHTEDPQRRRYGPPRTWPTAFTSQTEHMSSFLVQKIRSS